MIGKGLHGLPARDIRHLGMSVETLIAELPDSLLE